MEIFEYTIVTRRRHGDWLQAGPEAETVNMVIADQDAKLEPAIILNRFGADGWELIRTDYPGREGATFLLFKRPARHGDCLPASMAGDPRPA